MRWRNIYPMAHMVDLHVNSFNRPFYAPKWRHSWIFSGGRKQCLRYVVAALPFKPFICQRIAFRRNCGAQLLCGGVQQSPEQAEWSENASFSCCSPGTLMGLADSNKSNVIGGSTPWMPIPGRLECMLNVLKNIKMTMSRYLWQT